MPTPIVIPKSDVARMADELFGARQIQSISIPALNIESDVVPVGWRINFDESYQSGEFEWDSPDANVGWIITSALPDETGNIVLYGHNNIYGKIFQNLYDLQAGERIYLRAQNQIWEYKARYIFLLPILNASAEQAENYRHYLRPTLDRRVTLISCWPPQSNTHRVVVIAQAVEK
jgi:LPXTG-site transpeptidase (sortase) family protein